LTLNIIKEGIFGYTKPKKTEEFMSDLKQNTQDIRQTDEWDIDNLPNRLTILRMALIPIIVGSMWFASILRVELATAIRALNWIATFGFVIASVTDFLDGHIARKRNIVTIFGSFLDPIADKFLVASVLIMLQGLNKLPVIITIILVLREIYITALRLLASEKGLSVPVDKFGKAKTAVQMVGIPFILASESFMGISLSFIGTVLLYIATILSVYSASTYTMGLIAKLRQARIEKKKRQHAT